jgi:hypothetical protein
MNPIPDQRLLRHLRKIRSLTGPLIANLSKKLTEQPNLNPDAYSRCQRLFDMAEHHIIAHLERTVWTRGDSDNLREEEQQRKLADLDEDRKLAILEEEFVALRIFFVYPLRNSPTAQLTRIYHCRVYHLGDLA